MKPADYSPALFPTLSQQEDALRKGLGRAVQWAMAGKLDEKLFLETCLHDWRFDRTIEEYHGDWLWRIMQVAHLEDRFRQAILNALNNLMEDDAAQLCQLGFHYAANGDEAFRSRLYQIVQDKPFIDFRDLGEEEIIRLDGGDAFLFALGIRGHQLENREWDWDDSALMDNAISHLGEERVNDLIVTTAEKDIKRFCEQWRQEKDKTEQQEASRPTSLDKTLQLSASDIIATVESTVKNCVTIRIWGRHANDDGLKIVFEHLLSAHDPNVISNCLLVFLSREFPRVIPELISLSQHTDAEVRRRAIGALENNSHPLVRKLAEEELEKGVPDGLALGLFIKNYQDGDEHRILEHAQVPEDAEQKHYFFKDATKILEENPNADCSQLGVATYALIPCSFCRHYAAKLLRDRQVAPAWLIEECRFDVEPDTQKLFSEP